MFRTGFRGLNKDHLPIKEIEPFFRSTGTLEIEIGGMMLPLNLAHRHERRYAAAHILSLQYPQSDIDKMLFKRFVRPGDTLLDAGANIGFTALEALAAAVPSDLVRGGTRRQKVSV